MSSLTSFDTVALSRWLPLSWSSLATLSLPDLVFRLGMSCTLLTCCLLVPLLYSLSCSPRPVSDSPLSAHCPISPLFVCCLFQSAQLALSLSRPSRTSSSTCSQCLFCSQSCKVNVCGRPCMLNMRRRAYVTDNGRTYHIGFSHVFHVYVGLAQARPNNIY